MARCDMPNVNFWLSFSSSSVSCVYIALKYVSILQKVLIFIALDVTMLASAEKMLEGEQAAKQINNAVTI